jgi:hypothetical protein
MLPAMEPTDTGDDAEVTALSEEFVGKWHITRWPNGELDAAREPHRMYHVLEAHPAAMRATLAYIERRGSLIR